MTPIGQPDATVSSHRHPASIWHDTVDVHHNRRQYSRQHGVVECDTAPPPPPPPPPPPLLLLVLVLLLLLTAV
jgi:MYXO-CTERM domain-containing protein